jgi:hypothetical protein
MDEHDLRLMGLYGPCESCGAPRHAVSKDDFGLYLECSRRCDLPLQDWPLPGDELPDVPQPAQPTMNLLHPETRGLFDGLCAMLRRLVRAVRGLGRDLP